MTYKIPLCIPYIAEEEINAVTEAVKSNWLTHGPLNKEFENKFSTYLGVRNSITLNSCTSALFLAIKVKNITGEVIMPSFTFVATANAVLSAGAKPVFADIEADTYNIDPDKIEEKIAENTCAIMPVHYAGHPCDMDRILGIAKKHKLLVIEDSAETLGGEYKNKKTGQFGIGCFSFFPTKNITAGEGGMLTTDDDEFAAIARAYAGHGIPSSTYQRKKKTDPWVRSAEFCGYNFRMSNILAALGSVQMDRLDSLNELRRSHSKYLSNELSKLEEITIPVERENCKHVYQMYVIKLGKEINRKEFIMYLRGRGIEASVHFDPPVHLQEYYMKTLGHKKGDFPVTESVAESIVTLPMYASLSKEDLDYIIYCIREFINERT